MSDMKCPVCNVLLDECGDLLYCPNDHCSWVGNKELWQELIRTRKALEVAVDALKEISLSYQNGLDKPVAPAKWFSIATDMCDHADNAIEQITALEQKAK